MENSNLISPSSDFPITKPGTYRDRKRAGPMRTYGKRPSTGPSDSRSESSKKRQKSDHPSTELAHAADRCGAAQQEEANKENEEPADASVKTRRKGSSPGAQPEEPVSKSSILGYFKRVPVKAHEKNSGTQTEPEETSSSPKVRPQKRKAPRLLKIRSTNHETDHDGGEETERENKRPMRSRNSPGGASASSRSGRAGNSESPLSGPAEKPRAVPKVQTTLNVSSQAPFSECRECNTVWNPLFPDDAKYHAKRHAAVIARKQKERRDSAT